jgi:putative membrane protein
VPDAIQPKSNASDYLAAERTFLAWVRTALALMGFGFVVARFGLFLRELQIAQPSLRPRGYGFSVWFGTSLIVLGTLISMSSSWRYVRLVDDLNRGGTALRRPSRPAIGVALVLSCVGAAMAVALISVSSVD